MGRWPEWEKAKGSIIYDDQMGDADDAATRTAIEAGGIVIHNERATPAPSKGWAINLPLTGCRGELNSDSGPPSPDHGCKYEETVRKGCLDIQDAPMNGS